MENISREEMTRIQLTTVILIITFLRIPGRWAPDAETCRSLKFYV